MKLQHVWLLALFIVPHVRADAIHGKVIAIRDADTISIIDDENREVWVRLAEIDLPEKFQSHGETAHEALKDKTLMLQVRVEVQGEDPYGRHLGNVFVEDRWINKELVEEGHAWHFRHHSSNAELEHAEEVARAARVNLWETEDPVAPWKFREMQKSQRVFTIAEYLDRRTRVPDAYDAITQEAMAVKTDISASARGDAGGIPVPTGWLQGGPVGAKSYKKKPSKSSKSSTKKSSASNERRPTTRNSSSSRSSSSGRTSSGRTSYGSGSR